MDPRYTDFGAIEFFSIASYNTIKERNKSVAGPISAGQHFKALAVAWLGGGNSFATYLFKLVTSRTLKLRWKFRLTSLEPMLP